MTLLPGDIISTGTPSGIGPIRPGDNVTVHVEGVGVAPRIQSPYDVRASDASPRNDMKFFVDSGNLAEIKRLVPLGIVDGVTTNPSLLAKEPRDAREIIKEICQLVTGARQLRGRRDRRARHDRRRPQPRIDRSARGREGAVHAAGVEATRVLAGEGHNVNVTLVFSPTQALIAAKVGAAYVSPFVGRLDDIATDGMGLIRQIVEMYRHYRFQHAGARRQRPPSDAHRRGGADGRGRRAPARRRS